MDHADRDSQTPHLRTALGPPRRCRDRRRALGSHGETLAAAHLQRRGFTVVARNVRTRHGEIDLIACDGGALVFVEVKTRRAPAPRSGADSEGSEPSTPAVVAPLEGLRAGQRARLRRLAAAWLQDPGRARPKASTIRFDAIGVLLDGRGRLLRLDHIEGAW